jgi:dTDP-4-amino-4,6-dideoxygalactose transaminase
MFKIVGNFENIIADFFGSKYAVATDSCTHAIELCLRYKQYNNITVPLQTYISVPMTMIKLNLDWAWQENEWEQFYYIGNTNIIDAATLWKQNSYIPNTLMCLSFQFRKHLSLGRGGIILLDNKEDYTMLKKMSYDGRDLTKPWAEQDIDSVGYHYYMTPETADEGIKKFKLIKDDKPKIWTHRDYPDLSNMSVFK